MSPICGNSYQLWDTAIRNKLSVSNIYRRRNRLCLVRLVWFSLVWKLHWTLSFPALLEITHILTTVIDLRQLVVNNTHYNLQGNESHTHGGVVSGSIWNGYREVQELKTNTYVYPCASSSDPVITLPIPSPTPTAALSSILSLSSLSWARLGTHPSNDTLHDHFKAIADTNTFSKVVQLVALMDYHHR